MSRKKKTIPDNPLKKQLKIYFRLSIAILLFGLASTILFALKSLLTDEIYFLRYLLPLDSDVPSVAIIKIVLLGALGSGLWELLLKPLKNLLISQTFKFIDSNKDFSESIYQDIAMGLYENNRSFIFLCSVTLLSLLCLFDLAQYYSLFSEELMNIASVVLFFASLFSFFLCIYNYFILSYKTSMICHYKWLLARCDFYLNEEDKREIKMSFLKIKNKNDYDRICKMMISILKEKEDRRILVDRKLDLS